MNPNRDEQTVVDGDDGDDGDWGVGGGEGRRGEVVVTWIIKTMKGRCVSCTGPSQLRCKHGRLPGDRAHWGGPCKDWSWGETRGRLHSTFKTPPQAKNRAGGVSLRARGGGVRARAKCKRMDEKGGKTDVEKVTFKGWRRYEEEEEKGGKEKEDNFGCVHGALR